MNIGSVTPGIDNGIHVLTAQQEAIRIAGEEGIGKNSTNNFQKFNYRGIDDVMALVNYISGKTGFLITQVESRLIKEVPVPQSSGKVHYLQTYGVTTILRSAKDNSYYTDYSELTNTVSDPSKNLGISKSYILKETAIKILCIPIEGLHDDGVDASDSESQTVVTEAPVTPSEEVNKTGVVWEAKPKGKKAIMDWASKMVGGDELRDTILAETPADAQGKKEPNFVMAIRAHWENN